MDFDELMTALDEEYKERAEILLHIHKAVMSGELSPTEAEEVRQAMKG